MTTNYANFFYDLDHDYLQKKLADYKLTGPDKHVPSLRAVKAISGYLGHRQRSMAKHGGVAVDDSIGQVQKATGYSGSTISDVHRFLEWCGLEVRLKQGGGPKKQPTVRRLIPQIPREHLNGIISNLNEFYRDLDGETHNLNGAFPDTPRDLPRYIPRVCTSKKTTHLFEAPFNEEDFIDEEFGITPKDVLELLSGLERPDPFCSKEAMKVIRNDEYIVSVAAINLDNSVEAVIDLPENRLTGEPFLDALRSGDVESMHKDIERQLPLLSSENWIIKTRAHREVGELRAEIERIYAEGSPEER
jgi:hypothetical protein